jgi:hypothetical protein
VRKRKIAFMPLSINLTGTFDKTITVHSAAKAMRYVQKLLKANRETI